MLFRKNKDDFDTIETESKRWFANLGRYNKSKDDMTWNFKTGASMSFDHFDMTLKEFEDKYRGQQIPYIGIDELPQILNVLIGDMSFVGPRPNLATGNYAEFDEVRKKRLTVRPGITGYSQAYFRNSITQDEKFANDCYYVDHLSFIFDVKILIQTVLSVVGSKNINYKESNQKKDVAQ